MKRKGFSLIELMVATFITAIVVIAAYTLINNSTNSFKDENERRILESNLRNAELILQRDLSRVGYHVPMDEGTSPNNLRAVRTWIKTIDSKKYSEFSIVLDITDFEEGFLVKTSTDNGSTITVTIDETLLLPYTAAEVDRLDKANNIHPLRQEATPQGFQNAYKKAFSNAAAIYVESTNGAHAILPIVPPISTTSNTLVLNKSTLPADFNYEPGTGLRDLSIFPLIVITYRIIKDSGGTLHLQRCYNGSMYEPKIAQITQASCQTLISNLEYFELYPIHNDFDYLVQDNTKKVYLAHASTGSDTIAASNVTNFQIKDLNGFYYMLGAAGMRQTAISTTDATNPVMPRFNTAKQPLEHIQGTAMFKSPMTSSSNEYVYQATYNNSI